MKTTLEIPDALIRQAKSAAAEQGIAFRAFVSEALAEKLRVRGRPDKPWLKTFGKLRSLRQETAHIGRILDDDLRPEYDLSQLKGAVRGKYCRQAAAGTNLMLIESELAEVFGDAESVNRALRLLVDTAEAAASPTGRRHGAPAKRMQPARRKPARG